MAGGNGAQVVVDINDLESVLPVVGSRLQMLATRVAEADARMKRAKEAIERGEPTEVNPLSELWNVVHASADAQLAMLAALSALLTAHVRKVVPPTSPLPFLRGDFRK